jgi:GABA permease
MKRPSFARSSGLGRWPLKTSVLIVTSAGAVLILYGLVVSFVITPPALGWIGFAIMSTVVLSILALAPLAFERTRVSALRPADPVDQEKRLLVVVDSQCEADALCDEILASHGDAVATHIVVPVRVSHLHFVTDDENDELHEAQQSLLQMVDVLQQRAVAATGSVGSDKPLESMTDALGFFPATHVVLATPPEEQSYWLERDLLTKARGLTRASVTQVVVVTARPRRVRTVLDAVKQCGPRSGRRPA